jgi:chorismate-pyruvate lyase
MRRALGLIGFLLAGCAHAPTPATLELNARLLTNPSATAVLEGWCADRKLAAEPKITVRKGLDRKPAPAHVQAALHAAPGEPIGYREVQLVCGAVVLSVADNWYRPSQLTEAMNRTLETTDTPFGRVVAPLNFTRRRLTVREDGGAYVLEHRAVLSTAAGAPFSYVVERYTRAAVAAPTLVALRTPW